MLVVSCAAACVGDAVVLVLLMVVQKPWEKAARAALRKSGLSAAESNVVTTLTEHRWRVTERSAEVVEEALAEAMFCVVRNV